MGPVCRDLALAWGLDATSKQPFTIQEADHSVAFQHFGELRRSHIETVLPETYPERRAPGG